MIVKVHEHKLEIEKSPVNELEVNITKIKGIIITRSFIFLDSFELSK